MSDAAGGGIGVGVVITYRALPGKADVARDALAALIETVVAEEPACRGIQLFQGNGDPHLLLLTEQWDSEAAYSGPHLLTPHILAFRERAAGFLAGPPEITYWKPVSAAGRGGGARRDP